MRIWGIGIVFLFIGVVVWAPVNGETIKGKDVYQVCSSCHGTQAEGNPLLNAPALSGLEDWYLLRQLKNFKDGIRGDHPKDAYGTQMRAIVTSLDVPSLEAVSHYIASLEKGVSSSMMQEKAAAPEEERLALGKQIYRKNCFACHGVDPSHSGALGPSIENSSRELLQIRLEKGHEHYPSGYTPKYKTKVMPAFPQLIPQVDDLLAYLNQSSSLEEKEVASETMPIDPILETGKKTYLSTCSACHQANGEGKVGLAPSLTDQDFLSLASDDFIRETIQKGRKGTNMIPFAFLNETQIKGILNYLRSFQTKPSKQYDHNWKATGSVEKGRNDYNRMCSQCHGANGKGYLLGGSGTGIGLNSFINSAGDAFIREVMLSGRQGTPMRGFGDPAGLANLTPNEISDIIVYLRVLGEKNESDL